MIHLDTNVLIGVLRLAPASLRARLDETAAVGTPLAISSVVLFELSYGAAVNERRTVQELKIAHLLASAAISILAFDEEDALHAADIRATLKRLGQPIGPYDLQIAATARRHGATLVTANRREFDRIAGLSLIDWTE